MKRSLIIFLSGSVSALICIALFYLAGQMFGPLYQGEDESTRNFKVFLGALVLFIALGIWGGIRLTRKKL